MKIKIIYPLNTFHLSINNTAYCLQKHKIYRGSKFDEPAYTDTVYIVFERANLTDQVRVGYEIHTRFLANRTFCNLLKGEGFKVE